MQTKTLTGLGSFNRLAMVNVNLIKIKNNTAVKKKLRKIVYFVKRLIITKLIKKVFILHYQILFYAY